MKPEQYVQQFSRHRHLFAREDTPPGFWNLSFPRTPEHPAKARATAGAALGTAASSQTSAEAVGTLSPSLRLVKPSPDTHALRRGSALAPPPGPPASPRATRPALPTAEDQVTLICDEREMLRAVTQPHEENVDPSDVLLFMTRDDATEFGLDV